MEDAPGPSISMPYLETLSNSQRPNFYLLYYSLLVIGSFGIVLAVYNHVSMMGWCGLHRRRNQFRFGNTTSSSVSSNRFSPSTFKYRKGENPETASDDECVVCLAAFEEGDDLRQLPWCKHRFHAPCIDMWLFSNSNCPLCRQSAVLQPSSDQILVIQEELEARSSV